jgi:hypothetical protein
MQRNYEVLLGNLKDFGFFFFFFWGVCILLKHTSNEVALCKFNGVWCFLTVSQFTLYGILKGNKPDFHVAMPPQMAKPFYASLVERFQKSYNPSAIKGRVCFYIYLFSLFQC